MNDDVASRELSAGVRVCRQVGRPLLALVAVLGLLRLVGWTGVVTDGLHWATTLTGLLFGMERVWIFRFLRPRGKERLRLGLHAVAGVMVLVASVWMVFQRGGSDGWSLGGHVFIQAVVLMSGLASLIHHQTRFTAKAFHPGLVLMGSFAAIIVAGGLLLKMPRCVVEGETLSWMDAFFTSTSAVCVTGLAVENTATFFSATGKVVILLLIQVGGLGIMTLAFFAAVVLFEGLSLHDRLLLGRMIQENRLARIGQTLAFIVGMTLVCEAVGAVVLYTGLDGVEDAGERWFQAIFHSVSAFCNAGFSTFGDGLASGVVNGNVTWQVCIMALIVVGGIGSLVVEDLCLYWTVVVKRRMGQVLPRPRLRVHTRLVLGVTAFLLVGGAVVMWVTEFVFWKGPENGGTVLTAMFHSVTSRTAGFNTVSMSAIGPLTVQALMVFMLIGGSPGGTAGGMRTTVFAVGLAHLWNQLRMGRRGMVAFNRVIPRETGDQALGLMVLTVIWLLVNFSVLQLLEADSGVSESALLFELISAFATVGLSLDLTPTLGEGAKGLLILNMFVGRIGLLTVLATLVPRDPRPVSGKPSEDILLT
jgi:Trk-type K+ transport system membrane component